MKGATEGAEVAGCREGTAVDEGLDDGVSVKGATDGANVTG